MYLALSTYNTEFVALAVSMMNWSKGNSCCASGRRLGSQHCCLGWADRNDPFCGNIFDVSYCTLFISFENQTQVCTLGWVFAFMAKKIR